MKRLILVFLISLFSIFSFSQLSYDYYPAGYYAAANGKTGAALKTALYGIISSHKNVGYDRLYNVYRTSDNIPTNTVWDIYSYCDWTHGSKKCGNYSTVCDCYNREHTIPQSWFGSNSPMVSDAFHVYPTDGKVNGQRSNFPYGECSGGTTLANGKGRLGTSTFTGYSGTVFEPDDEYKGDLARTYFYFATCYQNIMTTIGGASFNNTTFPSFTPWSLNLFMKWNQQDPVSQKEIDRNNAISRWQENRNPYIDHPEYVNLVWGTNTVKTPSVLSSSATNITNNSATINGNVTSDGGASVSLRGFYYITATSTPSTYSLTMSGTRVLSGSGTGVFPSNLTGLSIDVQYYFIAFATNSQGTSYGSIVNFTPFYTIPAVSSFPATNITNNSATINGNATSDGGGNITQRGFYYITATSTPSIYSLTTTGTKVLSGSGTDSFFVDLSNIYANINYYFIAFATNSKGTSYGSVLDFIILYTTPSVSSSSATNITDNSATINGDISSDGGASVSLRGFYYITATSAPSIYSLTTSGIKVLSGSGMDNFSADLSNLSANTKYYFVAFATNSKGTSYGDILNFTSFYSGINILQDNKLINSGDAYNCNTVKIGTYKDIIFTIQNTGNTNLTISDISIVGEVFSLQGEKPISIAAGNSATFIVRMNPSAQESYQGILTIKNNDSNQGNYNIYLFVAGIFENTNVEDISLNDIKIYPNPSKNKEINIINLPNKYTKIELYNSIGEKIVSKEAKNKCLINITNQAKGLYILKIMSDGKLRVEKIIFE